MVSTSEVKSTMKRNEMKTTMHFAVIIIWFMYFVRGMKIFLTFLVYGVQ